MQVHHKIALALFLLSFRVLCYWFVRHRKKKAAALVQGNGGKQVHLAGQEVVKQHKTGIVSRKMPLAWEEGGGSSELVRFGGT